MQLPDIIETAIKANASDIHLTVDLPPVVRVNGRLLRMGKSKLTPADTLGFAQIVLSDAQFEKYRVDNEFDASYTYDNGAKKYYFRVNVFRQKNNCGLVMRLIPTEIPTLEKLNLPEVFRQLCMKRRGLILVTGPTGSGKTTTLAAMLEYMSRMRNEHIITIEDPIEYVFPHGVGIINQRQLGADTASFESAIRSAMREDPDVIMIGEMRDLNTISAALTAAETGHLVLSTLHTIGAAKTIDRVIDVFPAEQQSQVRVQLGSVLEAVVSQQLLPNRTGTGRKLAMEIMLSNHAIANQIREGKTGQIQNLMQMSSGEGMITMDQSLLELYRKGQIDANAALKYSVDTAELQRRMGM